MPARRLFAALGLVGLVITTAVATPRLARAALPLDAVLLLLFAIDFFRARGARLTAERRWPPLLVQGEPSEIEVAVVSHEKRGVSLLLREGLSPAVAGEPLRQAMELLPEREAVWTYRLTPRRRGDHAIAPLTARVLGPWRLAWAQRDLLPPERARVYPQVRWQGPAGRLLALAQRRELGLSPLATRGLGTEPYGVRGYLPGDPPGKIHWKATARHGRLITREETWERGTRLLILLDCGRAMASMAGERSKLDTALSAALALTRVAAARGDRVTTLAFSNRIERIVRMLPGVRGANEVYRRLFDVEAALVESAYDLAANEAGKLEPRQATVVLFTSLVDLAGAEVLRGALLTLCRRHRVLLVNLEDAELSRLAFGIPATSLEAFAKVSAIEILLSNRRLARKLRHAGIRILTAPADTLALEALNVYLGMVKSRPALRAGSLLPAGRPARARLASGG